MIYIGTVMQVKPPQDPSNINGYQYEYEIQGLGDNLTTMILPNAVLMDEFGAFDDVNERTIKPGQRVIFTFLGKSKNAPVILGSMRNYKYAMDVSNGHRWFRRFNKIVQKIDDTFTYTLTSDSGPVFTLGPTFIKLDDSVGENITLDKANKIMTINANEWKVNVVNNGTVTTGKKLSVTVGDGCEINVTGDVKVTASGNAKVTATKILLNGDGGDPMTGIITSNGSLNVVDVISGIPLVPSPTIFGDV